ncbi:hypothetical protein XENTR_v10008522 [Xenopus tropicalis]|nr:hypothetical protein XENTR_v10008522 [Xenopus tropicalis]
MLCIHSVAHHCSVRLGCKGAHWGCLSSRDLVHASNPVLPSPTPDHVPSPCTFYFLLEAIIVRTAGVGQRGPSHFFFSPDQSNPAPVFLHRHSVAYPSSSQKAQCGPSVFHNRHICPPSFSPFN